jgi:uncharacterized RDD family membrane protein YckC
MDFEPAYNRFSLAQMGQRVAASGIDIVVCLMLSSFLEALVGIDVVSGAGELIFCFVWLFNRVLVPTKNQGQSVGRWAMNLRVVDVEFGKTANVVALARREATVLIAMLIWIASLDSLTGAVILALIPVVVDIAPAFVDIDRRQALHDKVGDTIVINSRKGFELERKLLSFFGQANKFVRSSQKTLQQRAGQYGDRPGYSDYSDPYQDRYGSRASRSRYADPYDRGRTRAGYNAPESYGQAYREEVEPVDRYADGQDYGNYGEPEPWDNYAEYEQDDLDNIGDEIENPRVDRYAGQARGRVSRARTQAEPRYDRPSPQTRTTSRNNDQDWGDWGYDRGDNDDYEGDNPDYDDRYGYDVEDDQIDSRDRYNRSDYRAGARQNNNPPRRSSRSRSNPANPTNPSNQRRSPRRRNEY